MEVLLWLNDWLGLSITEKRQHTEKALYKAGPFPWSDLGQDPVYFKPESLLSYNFHFLFVYFWSELKPA